MGTTLIKSKDMVHYPGLLNLQRYIFSNVVVFFMGETSLKAGFTLCATEWLPSQRRNERQLREGVNSCLLNSYSLSLFPGGSHFLLRSHGRRNHAVVVPLRSVQRARAACGWKCSGFHGDPKSSWASKNFLFSLHEELFKEVLFPFTR